MISQNDRIILIEIGGSHDECLLTQMHAINEGGLLCSLVCTPDVKERNPEFSQWVDDFLIISTKKEERSRELRRIWQYIKDTNPRRVVLNTAQGSMVRDLCLKALFSKIEFVGIIHTVRKTQGSFTQKIISWKIKKYFVLSKYLLDKIIPRKGISYAYFYPIVFPGVAFQPKDHDELNITLIGGVENRRKDLDGFIMMIQSESTGHYFFLGKSEASHPDVISFKTKLKDAGLESRVTLYDDFVSHDEFTEILMKTDFILPLVHPDTPSAREYFNNQITGAMTISFSYKIPMLIHEGYSHIEEMKLVSYYYNLDSFGKQLESFIENREEKVAAIRDNKNYSRQDQKDRYLHFLLG